MFIAFESNSWLYVLWDYTLLKQMIAYTYAWSLVGFDFVVNTATYYNLNHWVAVI